MKTADEMFRELGYEKLYEGRYRKSSPSGNQYTIQLIGNHVEKRYACDRYGEIIYELTCDEVLACAQLIREMGCADA